MKEFSITDRELMESFGAFPDMQTFIFAKLIDLGAPIKLRKYGVYRIERDNIEFLDGYDSVSYEHYPEKKLHIWKFEKQSEILVDLQKQINKEKPIWRVKQMQTESEE